MAFECINRNLCSQGRRKAVLEIQEMDFEEVERCGGGKKAERRADDDVGETDDDRARIQSEGRQHWLAHQEMKGNAQHVHRVAVLRDSLQETPAQRSEPARRTETIRRNSRRHQQRKRGPEKRESYG